jgi:hypothetical protein
LAEPPGSANRSTHLPFDWDQYRDPAGNCS